MDIDVNGSGKVGCFTDAVLDIDESVRWWYRTLGETNADATDRKQKHIVHKKILMFFSLSCCSG